MKEPLKIFGATQEDRDRIREYLKYDKKECISEYLDCEIPLDAKLPDFSEVSIQHAIHFYDALMLRNKTLKSDGLDS